MGLLRRSLASLCTEEDDKTPDWSRITWLGLSICCLLAVLLYLAIGVMIAVKSDTFDFVGFGNGLAALLAGVAGVQVACAAGLAIKFRSGA
jgi:hypothetical protein